MKMKVFGLILLVLVIAGCAQTSVQPAAPAEEEATEEQIVIGFSLGSLQEDRWKLDRDIFIEKAESLGAEVLLEQTAGDADLQNTQMRNLISQGVDVIVIVPEDGEKIAPLIGEANAAGIKTVSYDRIIKNTDKLDLYISFQNVKVGELQAKGILDVVSSGKFAYIGGAPTDNNAFLFKEGAFSLLQPKIDSGDIELVLDKMTPGWNPDTAYQNMKAFLDEGGEVDAVVAANDGTASGVIRALEEHGLAGTIPVSGQDAELTACQRIVKGTQTMTVYKPIKLLAEAAADVAVKMAKGETVATNDKVDNGAIDVPSYLLTPVFVDKNNIDSTVIADGFQSKEDVYS